MKTSNFLPSFAALALVWVSFNPTLVSAAAAPTRVKREYPHRTIRPAEAIAGDPPHRTIRPVAAAADPHRTIRPAVVLVHYVEEGDTCFDIAQKTGASFPDLVGKYDCDHLRVGQIVELQIDGYGIGGKGVKGVSALDGYAIGGKSVKVKGGLSALDGYAIGGKSGKVKGSSFTQSDEEFYPDGDDDDDDGIPPVKGSLGPGNYVKVKGSYVKIDDDGGDFSVPPTVNVKGSVKASGGSYVGSGGNDPTLDPIVSAILGVPGVPGSSVVVIHYPESVGVKPS